MIYLLRLFRPLVGFNYKHPYTVLFLGALLAMVSVFFAARLKLDTDLASLLPPDNKHVVAMEELRATVGGETAVNFVIASPDFEANLAFAKALIPRALALYDERSQSPFFNRYEFTRDNEVLKDYALYLATHHELDEIIEYLENRIEDAKLEANPFFIDFDDFDDEEEESDELKRFQELYRDLVPSFYPVNEDSTILVLDFFPTGSRSNTRFLQDMFAASDQLIAEMQPHTYHPEMIVMAGGRLKRHLQELDFIVSDVASSFASGIGSVVLLVAFYFFLKKYINYRRGSPASRTHSFWQHAVRFPVPVFIIGLPLFISLFLTFGIAYFVIGSLNTMTSVLFVILFGLGIDYGLHFYARYLEKRSGGQDILETLYETYDSTGAAIMASALTTAVALFVLVFADFRGFSEFGFISGTGIVLAFMSMLFIMPALLVLAERWNWILINTNDANVEPNTTRYPYSRLIVIIGVMIGAYVFWNSDQIRYNYNFSELEPEFAEYQEFRAFSGQVNQTSRRNPAYILASSDEEVMQILQAVRELMEHNPETTIRDVEALQERFPVNTNEEIRKLERIAEVYALLQDPFIIDQEDDDLDILRRASNVREPLAIEDVPDYLKNRFLTRDGEIGRFVMIYPGIGLSDGLNSIAFKNEIGTVTTQDGSVYHAASTSIVAAEMLELMRKESPYMVAITFVMIFIIVTFAFSSLRWAIIAMLPLVVGLIWTFAIMITFGITLNFYNMVVLPAIIGIGNDNGVHLANRYREEGKKSMGKVLRSTGQHITIGSFTTMLGFAGLLLTSHPGLYSIGLLAVIGIGMTLLSGLTFLPALVQWLEDKNWIRF